MDMQPTPDEERIRLLDAMATMADRATRTDTFRFHIEELRKVLLSRLQDDAPATFEVVGQGLYRCGINLPFKAPMYATLAGLLTAAAHPFCKPLANGLSDAVVKELVACLRDGHASTARRALRYLACLANASVVSPTSVATYIIALLDAAQFELTSANRSEFGVHCRGDFLAEIALSVLPWVASTLQARAPDEMNTISGLVDQIIDAWKPNMWRCVAPSVERRCIDTFSQLLEAIAELRDSNWVCNHDVIQKPYNVFEVELSTGQEITLPPLAIPGHSKVTYYSAPRFRLVLVNPREEPPYVPTQPSPPAETNGDPSPPTENNTQMSPPTEANVDSSPPAETKAPTSTIPVVKSENVDEDGTDQGEKKDGTMSVDVIDISGQKPTTAEVVDAAPKTSIKVEASSEPTTESTDGTSIRADVMDISAQSTVTEQQTAANATGMDISAQSTGTEEQAAANATTAENEKEKEKETSRNDGDGGAASATVAEKRTPLLTYVIRSYIGDVVDNFSSRHVMAAERLLNLPMLKDVNDEIVECLFSQMCAMPSPTFLPVYYGTLFADLCRVKDSRLPAKLLVAVNTMFEHAEEMDPESFDRLTEWFSFHLSNFGYRWNWQEWAVYADPEMVDKFPYRALFCKDVIARSVRLSYYERIEGMLPEDMRVFMPPKPSNGNQTRFEVDVNSELMKIVTGKGRLPWPKVRERLEFLIPVAKNDLEEEGDKALDVGGNLKRLSALIRAIMQAGCRTLSHFDIVVERYMDLLRLLSTSGGQPARRLIVTEVTSFWSNVHIRRMYVLHKLAQYHVIDHMSILDCCLTYEKLGKDGMEREMMSNAELKVQLAQSSRWEIIRLVMSRARAREVGSRRELVLASKNAATANEGEQEKAEERLEKAKLITEEAKREIRDLLLEGLRRLFEMTGRLMDDGGVDMEVDGGGEGERMRMPGFNGGPIWYWRCVGMIRELARMHPPHLAHLVADLDEFTKELRENHRVLWEAFEIIREIEKCSLHTTVW